MEHNTHTAQIRYTPLTSCRKSEIKVAHSTFSNTFAIPSGEASIALFNERIASIR